MINFSDYYILESNGNAEYNNASIGDIAEALFASAIAFVWLTPCSASSTVIPQALAAFIRQR